MIGIEAKLAERSDRRKKRRNYAYVSSTKSDTLEFPEEVQYCDTDTQALAYSPNADNPCAIDKVASVAKRRYGGLMVMTLPCGRVAALMPVIGGESLTQVYALLAQSISGSKRKLQYVFYDNACALARFSRHSTRCDRTVASKQMAQLIYVLDGLHIHNHTACLDPDNSLYMPEVKRDEYNELEHANSQTCEQ